MSSRTYGRMPRGEQRLLDQAVDAADEIARGELPQGASHPLYGSTLDALTEIILRDWLENDNTGGLEPKDRADLASFVRAALAVATPLESELRVEFYRVVLDALLTDWCTYWNADGVAGPPQRLDQDPPVPKGRCGRLPQSVFAKLEETRNVAIQLAEMLPMSIASANYALCVTEVAKALLNDMVENDQVEPMEQSDLDDLRSFVQFAHDRSSSFQFAPWRPLVFQRLLNASLSRWCGSWNDGIDGPPEVDLEA